jgi:hypothetical protein
LIYNALNAEGRSVSPKTIADEIAEGANKFAFHLKYVSASRRRNAGEGAAGLSNQHASGVCSREFPLR